MIERKVLQAVRKKHKLVEAKPPKPIILPVEENIHSEGKTKDGEIEKKSEEIMFPFEKEKVFQHEKEDSVKEKPEKDLGMTTKQIVIDRKLYKLGDIVEVGYAPYFKVKGKVVKKDKKINSLWALKAQRVVLEDDAEEEIDLDEPDLEAEEHDYPDEMSSEREEEEMNEEDVVDEDDEPENIEKEEEPIIEKGFEYTYQRINRLDEEQQEIANRMGLDLKERRLVKVPYKRQVYDAKLRYGRYEKQEVVEGPGGRLMLRPYRQFSTINTDLMDEDELPVVPESYKPVRYSLPAPPKEYKGELRFGDCVKLVINQPFEIEGAVLGLDVDSFDLVTRFGRVIKKIPYAEVFDLEERPMPSYMHDEEDSITIVINTEKPTKYRFDKWEAILSEISEATISTFLFQNRYVSFTRRTMHAVEGHVSGFESKGFVIYLPENKQRISISYDYPTLEKIKCISRHDKTLIKAQLESEEVLELSVTESSRLKVVKILFDLLAALYPGTYESSSIDDNPELKLLKEKINWDVIRRGKTDWTSLYRDHFYNWMWDRYLPLIKPLVPDYSEYAAKAVLKRTDPVWLVNQLTDRLGEDLFDGSASDILLKMKNNFEKGYNIHDRPYAVIDTVIQRGLQQINSEELDLLRGKKLGRLIAQLLLRYLRMYPPNARIIKENEERNWIKFEIDKKIPTPEDRKMFEYENAKKLHELLERETVEYEENKIALERYKSKRQELLSARYALNKELTGIIVNNLDGKALSRKGYELYQNVVELEKKLFILSGNGETNFPYLQRVFQIVPFLDPASSVGRHSKFFRAKIASGHYRVANLDSATLYHAFPEFFINEELSDSIFNKAITFLGHEIYKGMIDFIDLWILQKQKPALRHKIDVDWKKYTIDLESECNGLRIQKEAQLTGDSKNIVDYDCTKTEQDNSYHCVAKREPIPLDDLILCYSDGKFNCLSINDVLHALADRKRGERSINPHTGKEYEVDFLNRMEDRYGDLLDLEKYPHRIIEFTTEDRFGYGDKIFPDDEDLSFEISETTQPILSIPKTLDEALAGEQDLTILYFYQVWELGHKYFVTKDIVDEIDKLKSPQFKIIFIDLQDSAELWNSIKGKVKNKTPIFVIFKKGKIISKIKPTENLIKEILEKTNFFRNDPKK